MTTAAIRLPTWHWAALALAAAIFAAGLAGGLLYDAAPSGDDLAMHAEAGAEQLVTISTRPGVTQDLLLVKSATEHPVAALVLFAGGEGDLNLAARGEGWLGTNVLVRSRFLFAAEGFDVAVIDTPSDHPHGFGGFRTSDQHAADIAAVVAYLREQSHAPVWLVGASRGAISAANGALLRDGGPDGLVLASPVTRGSKLSPQTVLDLPLENLRLPTLLVHSRDDTCQTTRYQDVVELKQRLKHVAKLDIMTFAGSQPSRFEPCEGLSRHGYLGIEREVIASIAAWVRAAQAGS